MTSTTKAKTGKVTRRVWLSRPPWSNGVVLFDHMPHCSDDNDWLRSFCLDDAKSFFDLRGMKPGDVREFTITTEPVKKKPKRKGA